VKKEFIEIRDVWGNHALKQVHKDRQRRIVSGLFKLGIIRRVTTKINKESITNAICIVNMVIPCTVWPVTNPIIKKISGKFDLDKVQRKVNCVKMRMRF